MPRVTSTIATAADAVAEAGRLFPIVRPHFVSERAEALAREFSITAAWRHLRGAAVAQNRKRLDRVAAACDELAAAVRDLPLPLGIVLMPHLSAGDTSLPWPKRLVQFLEAAAAVARQPFDKRPDANRRQLVRLLADDWRIAGRRPTWSRDQIAGKPGPFVLHVREVFDLVGVKAPERAIIKSAISD